MNGVQATRVKFNRKAFPAIRRLPTVERYLGAKAQQIATACGGDQGGYFAQTSLGRTRARAVVIAGTSESVHQNATENTLIKHLDAGRG